MKHAKTPPPKNLALQLKNYIRDPANATTLPVQICGENDMSYFPTDEQGEIEVNNHFYKNNTYLLTISRKDKPTKTETLETKFSDKKQTLLNCKTILYT